MTATPGATPATSPAAAMPAVTPNHPGMRVIERGWLSANNVLLASADTEGAVLIDSGHSRHAAQTVALVSQALADAPGQPGLSRIVNTHLHSDHCGGNAALHAHFGATVWVPPGQAAAARAWDVSALSYAPTGQHCERFEVHGVVQPGDVVSCGAQRWQAMAAPGHDPHSLIFFNADTGVLIAADALWENGFGVVFPEIEGIAAFDEVATTLDLIETLPATLVIPGHGPAFGDVAGALARARSRLAGFRTDPGKHARYAAKVLVKYHLMEERNQARAALQAWLQVTPLLWMIHARLSAIGPHGSGDFSDWCTGVVDELLRQGALRSSDGVVWDA